MNERSNANVNAVLVADRTLYAAVSDRIVAYSIADPIRPKLTCEAHTRGAPYLLARTNGALFVMEVFHEGEELSVFTHAGETLTESVRIHVADFVSGFPRDMRADGNDLIVADIYRGLYTIDISNAEHPLLREGVMVPGLQSVHHSGTMLFAGSDHGDVISFTRSGDGWKPGVSLSVVEGCVESLAFENGTLCAAFGRYGSHGYTGFSGIAFLECDAASMRERSRIELDRNAMGVHIKDGVAAVLLQEWGHEWYDTASGVRMYDIADPDTPLLLGTYERKAKFEHWNIAWPYAYVADRMFGVRIIDLSDPKSPREVAEVPVPGLSG
ncbi:MAG: hypothetical protein AABZ39_05165 [Spirochaetota bacterium]